MSKKPTKRQQAIIQLINIIEGEGLHYGIVNYGVSSQLKIIKNEKLSKLAALFIKTSEQLESEISALSEAVKEFDMDEVDL